MPARSRRQKKRSPKQKNPSPGAIVPHAIPREPPPVVVTDDEHGKRAAYVRAPVSSETAAALENLFTVAGSLFRAVGGALSALERETQRRRGRRRG